MRFHHRLSTKPESVKQRLCKLRDDIIPDVELLLCGRSRICALPRRNERLFRWDTLDLIRGKHNIRFGATYRAEEMNVRNNAFQDGYVVEAGLGTGDDIADLLLGSTGVFAAHDQTFMGATTGRRWKLIRPFVQDDWRVTSNLTLNIWAGVVSGYARNGSRKSPGEL